MDNTPKLLNVLLVEDSQDDATMIVRELERAGFEVIAQRVDMESSFLASLHAGLDLILADYRLPSFDGLRALELLNHSGLEVPFIIVSGSIGEDLAAETIKRGASDYLIKDRLARLGPAVRHAFQHFEERKHRRQIETQFLEAQKMEVIGQLAAGVAHDFNNIVAVIMGYSDLLLPSLASDDKNRGYVEAIRSAAERAGGLTRQLLIFSRDQKVQLVVLDINEVIYDLNKMLARLVNENIELTVLPGHPLGRVKADSGYIGQVLMNLVVNARDAMPNGGRLTIATENITLDEVSARAVKGAIPGDYVKLSVCDTGTGMTDAVKARIFEAFFTTKPKGKGTGLGLATCQSIVDQSGGFIEVKSELGRGTTFKIYFPRVDQSLEVAAKSPTRLALPRGTETLLVVEDEPPLRKLASRVLEAQGYSVISAANGEEALYSMRDHKGSPIDLVVTDVIMPKMSGKIMAEQMKAANADLKILFTSGYTDETIDCHGVFETGVDFLPKPYTPSSLACKIREILDGKKLPGRTIEAGSLPAITAEH